MNTEALPSHEEAAFPSMTDFRRAGLSKRELVAIAALQGMLSSGGFIPHAFNPPVDNNTARFDYIASAYEISDAMLARGAK